VTAGWNAKGLLEPLWGKVGGRDELAKLTGIQRGTLSGYNTGRLKLGLKNGPRIAEALKVTLYDLGAPEEADNSPQAQTIRDQLANLIRRHEELEALVTEGFARLATGGSAGGGQQAPEVHTEDQP